ncbi:hypothetical protein GGF46_000034 [Coemansia sp. RSA 552]|nr:hypothetical protein GGF46_000034 [Coemansia sp. RSA 552]
MDRRVSLPSFHEIAGALPRPASISPTTPQPIPYDSGPRKRPTSPLPFHRGSAAIYQSTAAGDEGGGTYYALDTQQGSYNGPPAPGPQPHRFSSSHSQPQPRPQLFFGPGSPPLAKQHRAATKVSYGKDHGVITIYDAQLSQGHRNNVYGVAQVAAIDPAAKRPLSIAATSPASSLPQSPPFMHSALSSRYAPYHMPSTAPLGAASLPSPGGARISPPLSSPTHRHPRGAAAIDPASRVAASSFATQCRPAAAAAAAQIPHRSPPHAPKGPGQAAPRHLQPPFRPTRDHPTRDHPMPELMGEKDDDDEEEDENESLGCYDEAHPGVDKNGSAEGAMMSSAKIRTIHKLAERRRRREMKALFESLRKCLPIDKTIRLSKWEILKKAVEVISNQDTEIRMLRLHIDSTKALPSNPAQ